MKKQKQQNKPDNGWHFEVIEGTYWVSNGQLMLSPQNFVVFYDSGRLLKTKSADKCRNSITMVNNYEQGAN